MKCQVCVTQEGFYRRENEGLTVCKSCFIRSIEERIRRTISRYKMLEPDDHVAVALSGGKDSLTLLSILSRLMKRFPRSRITAVIVDEGIRIYRDEALQIATEICGKLGVERHVVSFNQLYGVTTDDFAPRDLPLLPCSYCGVLRRRAINKGARDVGASKVATGHNLDDEVQTIMLNMLRGDVIRIARIHPHLDGADGKFLPRIKPLCEIPEREVVLYAYLKGFPSQSHSCPHGSEALRADIRNMLNRLEHKHPGTKFSLYRAAEGLRNVLRWETPREGMMSCASCGEPSASEICEPCRMRAHLASVVNRTGN